tara:strand:- start:1680 stop:3458 length:1779 start_codon:yes stop_codon:yes gene_type:complete
MKAVKLKFKSITSLLERHEKIKLLYVFIIYIISVFLDIIGIGLIIPLLTLILSGEFSQSFSQYLPSDITSLSPNNLILVVLLFFFLFYIFKSIFSTFALWYERSFIYEVQQNLSVKLLNKYMIEDYQYFLRRNYADLVRNITVEAGLFVSGVIHGFVAVVSEVLIVIGISALLIIVDPISSLTIIGVITSIVTTYLLVFKKKLRSLGFKKQNLESSILDQLNKSFLLFREMRIFSRQKSTVENFEGTVKEKNKISLFEDLLNGLPKIYFELLFVILVNSVLIYLIYSGAEIKDIIPILGLYAAAFFRIFPSFNRLIGAINGLIHNLAAFDLIKQDLDLLRIEKKLPLSISNYSNFQNFLTNEEKPQNLELKNISFSYKMNDKKINILEDLNLIMKSGEITGLIGESGSGKSTIANIINGFIEIDKGEFKINNNSEYNKNMLSHLVGYLPQTTNLINDTLLNNICFYNNKESEFNHKKIDEIISTLEMKNMIDSLPQGLNSQIHEQGQIFSGGQRQKIALARMLYRDAPILVFDESTSSLDINSEKKLLELINIIKKDRIILFITHNRNLTYSFDRTYLLENRKILKHEYNSK